MKIERLILPLAVASTVIAVGHLFGPIAGVGYAFALLFVAVYRLERDRRRWEERQRRDYVREQTWKLGDRRLR